MNYELLIQVDSWTILSNKRIVKKADKSIFKSNETGVPKDIQYFFDVQKLSPGARREITLIYNKNQYSAYVRMDTTSSNRTKLKWESDFTKVIKDKVGNVSEKIISGEAIVVTEQPNFIFERVSTDTYKISLTFGKDYNLVQEGTLSLEQIEKEFEQDLIKSKGENRESRKKRLEATEAIPQQVTVTTIAFKRNPDVVAEVLERANGVCEKCGNKAPFMRASDSTPYLEVHHKIRLADGGEDTVENTIGICPNCHRELHYGIK